MNNIEIVMRFVKEGFLSIDESGAIWRMKQKVGGQAGNIISVPPRRAENKTPNGYLQVQVWWHGRRYTCSAHELVWFSKHGAIPEMSVIHHKNRNRCDNRIENLTCVSHKEHVAIHEPSTFPRKRSIKEYHHKTVRSKVANYRNRAIETYHAAKHRSVRDVARTFNITTRSVYQRISDCKQRGWLDYAENIPAQQ